MPQVALFLFGAPRIKRNGAPVAVDTRKAIALLTYLAMTRKPQARATLRRTLSALNKALDGPLLDAQRETIRLNVQASLWTDVDDFRARGDSGTLCVGDRVRRLPAPPRQRRRTLH